ncbi:protein trachealess [Elysia marginata]|uniref:Protein trachealess n=1 Tax=Elysia marginata TaxID=1093978 RepID=A0AAV4IRZ0_9GAST|nr:protein trachealess [Elysia marginata]
MAGSSIFDYVHPEDHTELAEYLDMCLVPAPSSSSAGSGSDDGSQPPTPRPGSPTEKSYTMIRGPHTKQNKSFSVRMKSTLTKRGVHVKTSGYRVSGASATSGRGFKTIADSIFKTVTNIFTVINYMALKWRLSYLQVVHVLGSLRPLSSLSSMRPASNPTSLSSQAPPIDSQNAGDSGGAGGADCHRGGALNGERVGATSGTDTEAQLQPMGMVGMAIALPPPSITELRLELDTFITRLTPDFKVVYCEPIINDLMDLHVDDLTDRLMYDLCHPADLKSLQRSHTDILRKGQALTDYYRLMNRTGGFVWVQTCATTLLNNKNSEDQSILAINYVVSGAEEMSTQMDLWQLTGDVSAVMSSSCDSAARREKLKELKANRTVKQLPNNNNKTQNKAIKRSSPGGGGNPKDDKASASEGARLNNMATNKEKSSSSLKLDSSGEASDDDSDDVFHDQSSDSVAVNGKNVCKRRKMDKPKKHSRSREQPASGAVKRGAPGLNESEPPEKALNLTRHDGKTRECSPSLLLASDPNPTCNQDNGHSYSSKEENADGQRKSESQPTKTITTASANAANLALAPEDLSMKRPQHGLESKEKGQEIAGRNIIQHSSFSSHTPSHAKNQSPSASSSSPRLQLTPSSNCNDRQRASLESDSHSPLILPSQNSEDATYGSGSSVQDLEAAMSRHLPENTFHTVSSSHNTEGFHHSSFSSISPYSQPATTYSSSTPGLPSLLAVGHSSSYHPSEQSPTGSSAWLTPPRANGSELLTASNFLRSLYAASTRESVIKTGGSSGHTSSFGTAPAASRAQFIHQDHPPSTLLTPPEPDPVTYRLQPRGKDTDEETHKSAYSYRMSDSFSNQSNFPDHQHHILSGRSYGSDTQVNRDQLVRSKELFSPNPFLSFKDYPQNYQPHHYLHISGQAYSQGGEYTYHQNQASNLRNHLHQSVDNSPHIPPPSSSSTYKLQSNPSIINPSSSPYKDVIPAFNIPSLLSPTTPAPVGGAGTDVPDGGSGRRLQEEFHQNSVNLTNTSSSLSHQLPHQQHHVDTLSMTPPASASPDPNKIPALSTYYGSDTVYLNPAAHAATGRQPMGSSNNLSCFPYQHHYTNSFGRNPSEGVIKGTMYSVGSFMDLNSGSSQYESCPRPVLSWY